MNILKSTACLVSAILFSASLHAAPVKVFLLAGQSNMRGMGNPADLKAPYTESPAAVKIWEGKSWMPLVPKGNNFGPEIAFGHAMAKQMPGVEIRLVKFAVSGSNLHKRWAPTAGDCYKVFINGKQVAARSGDELFPRFVDNHVDNWKALHLKPGRNTIAVITNHYLHKREKNAQAQIDVRLEGLAASELDSKK